MEAKAVDKERLIPLQVELTSELPDGSTEREELQNRLDSLNKKWADLSNKLGQHKTELDSLTPWVPQTLERLENLGPPPTEPEKVQELKVEIEVCTTHLC